VSRIPPNSPEVVVGMAAVPVLLLILSGAWFWGVGWWMDYTEEPRKADLIVVLAGSYARPFGGAELFKRGFAPEIWLSRPYHPEGEDAVRRLGIPLRVEEEVNQDILRRSGVPAEAIRLFGNGVLSTYNEALALQREAPVAGKTILVVTSRYHARRAGMIFRKVLRDSKVVMVASPTKLDLRRWWKHRELAAHAVLETCKTAYHLLGGSYVAPEAVVSPP